MKACWTTAAALALTTVAWITAPAAAGPTSSSLALKSYDAGSVESVRSRRSYRSHYASARRYYRGSRAYRGSTNRSYRGCTGDSSTDSAFPSWMCQ